jgi:hypothetical protein
LLGAIHFSCWMPFGKEGELPPYMPVQVCPVSLQLQGYWLISPLQLISKIPQSSGLSLPQAKALLPRARIKDTVHPTGALTRSRYSNSQGLERDTNRAAGTRHHTCCPRVTAEQTQHVEDCSAAVLVLPWRGRACECWQNFNGTHPMPSARRPDRTIHQSRSG